MKYLDYNRMPGFLERYFGSDEIIETRRAGPGRGNLTDYHGIVRFFGTDGIDPRTVRVRYRLRAFSFRDERIRGFSSEIERRLRCEGRLFEGPPAAGVVDACFDTRKPHLTVQPVNYGDHAGSCFALDAPHPLFREWGGSLRDYYLSEYGPTAIKQSPLALCLGVCGLVVVRESSDRWVLLVRRSARLASLGGTIGCSAAGSVDFCQDYPDLRQLTIQSMSAEVVEELSLQPDEFTVTPLAWAREIFRGEKPQLFCLIETVLDRAQLTGRLGWAMNRPSEFTAAFFIPIATDHRFERVELPSALNHEAQMNRWLAAEYWGAAQVNSM